MSCLKTPHQFTVSFLNSENSDTWLTIGKHLTVSGEFREKVGGRHRPSPASPTELLIPDSNPTHQWRHPDHLCPRPATAAGHHQSATDLQPDIDLPTCRKRSAIGSSKPVVTVTPNPCDFVHGARLRDPDDSELHSKSRRVILSLRQRGKSFFDISTWRTPLRGPVGVLGRELYTRPADVPGKDPWDCRRHGGCDLL